jgi:hypothetical protein
MREEESLLTLLFESLTVKTLFLTPGPLETTLQFLTYREMALAAIAFQTLSMQFVKESYLQKT